MLFAVDVTRAIWLSSTAVRLNKDDDI